MNLEDLIVELRGDTTQYQAALQAAANVTTQAGQTIEQVLNNALAAQAAAMLNVQGGAARLKQSVDSLTQRLEVEALTFGMTARQAAIYRLELMGASTAQLEMARAADAHITAQEEQRAKARATAQAIVS